MKDKSLTGVERARRLGMVLRIIGLIGGFVLSMSDEVVQILLFASALLIIIPNLFLLSSDQPSSIDYQGVVEKAKKELVLEKSKMKQDLEVVKSENNEMKRNLLKLEERFAELEERFSELEKQKEEISKDVERQEQVLEFMKQNEEEDLDDNHACKLPEEENPEMITEERYIYDGGVWN